MECRPKWNEVIAMREEECVRSRSDVSDAFEAMALCGLSFREQGLNFGDSHVNSEAGLKLLQERIRSDPQAGELQRVELFADIGALLGAFFENSAVIPDWVACCTSRLKYCPKVYITSGNNDQIQVVRDRLLELVGAKKRRARERLQKAA